jgi:CRISPR system Cascade subunit CasC
MNSLFVQIHTLTAYPASLLNRDDIGFAKRIPFGGASRTRISSQCLKRHWRTFDGADGLGDLGIENATRSRHIFQRLILEPLKVEGKDPAVAERIVAALSELVQKAKAQEAEGEEREEGSETEAVGRTQQPMVLGRPEIEFLLGEARALCDEGWKPDKKSKKDLAVRLRGAREKNLKALARAAGLDAALFGRMVTSDIVARGDGAVHVAHAFTVHAESAESDYFSVVDDLQQDEGELGAAHINTSELTTGLFYGYVVIDVPLLVSNLEGCDRKEWQVADRHLAAEVASRLVRLIATVSPGAKKGSTAPYSFAHLVLAESGTQQPRTLANAFLKPVPERPDLVANAYRALSAHIGDLDDMYGNQPARSFAALGDAAMLGVELGQSRRKSLDDIGQWVAAQVRGS